MSDNRIHLVPGVLVENFGDNVMVSLPDRSEVLSLTGDMAEIVVALRDGEEVSPNNGDALTELERRGVITLSESSGLSRRQILTAGAAGVTGGVLALSMPAAAAASSFVCPVVTGELDRISATLVGGTVFVRLRLSPDFSPLGTYWLEVFDNPSGDGETRGASLGLNPIVINVVGSNIQGDVERSKYDPFPGAGDDVIGVLYSDENRACLVGEVAGDFD